MIEMKCQACGAPLERDGHCAYCGSRYKVDNDRIMFMEYRPGIKKVVGEVTISDFLSSRADEEQLGKIAEEQIAYGIAKELGSMIKYRTNYDPFSCQMMIRGEVRVVEPDFRF